jgi:hypothetical protein
MVSDGTLVPVDQAKVELSKRALVATSTTDKNGIALFKLDTMFENTNLMVWVNGKTTQNIRVLGGTTCNVTYAK